MNNTQYTCTEDDDSKRIDYVLENLTEEMGLRGRRRLCEQGLVFINDKKAKASDRVRENNTITLHSPTKNPLEHDSQQNDSVYIVKEDANYAAIFKPAQMHSEKLNGMATNNIQEIIPTLFENKKTILLNRLDFATSGIIMLAFSTDAEEKWKLYQNHQNTKKNYIAIVEGKLEREINITYTILLRNKHSVRVDKNSRGTRHTKVYPLAYAKDKDNNDVSLVSCVITQGARHQIRAHLASIEHALVNDIKYGAKKQYTIAELVNLSILQSPFTICNTSNKTEISSTEPVLQQEYKIQKQLFLNESQDNHNENDSREKKENNSLEKFNDVLLNTDENNIYKMMNTKKHNSQLIHEEYFILHHIKMEFSLFEVSCLPMFWKNIPLDVQQHILSHI